MRTARHAMSLAFLAAVGGSVSGQEPMTLPAPIQEGMIQSDAEELLQ